MAGHSQFKNIMHKKGKQDAIRSKLFSKLAREITVAAKLGLPDPAMNARLRAAVLAARALLYETARLHDDGAEISARAAALRLVSGPAARKITSDAMQICGAYGMTRDLPVERLYREGAERAKIMAIAIHPYISGQPHRIKYLEAIYDYARRFDGVEYWTGEEILQWYLKAKAQ